MRSGCCGSSARSRWPALPPRSGSPGPLIRFADARPLEPVWLRAAIIGVVVGTAVVILWGPVLAKAQGAEGAGSRHGRAPSDDDSDANVLEAGMNEAVATLKRSSGKRNFLYEVPWYIVIGPPGAGKTTALVNSGLKFPLAGSGQAQPVAGVGGTRNCDWWFTDEAVLIDTAGRYTTQDSNARSDQKSWLAFLSLLKQHRAQAADKRRHPGDQPCRSDGARRPGA